MTGKLVLKAVTFDCWGTLVLDGPGRDDQYQRQRLLGFQSILSAAGSRWSLRQLDRAYVESARQLASLWRERRDVPVTEHVHAILRALDRQLPECLRPVEITELIAAYATPALSAPPPIDAGARTALEELTARGLALCLVSNTMRTPGAVFRQIFDRAGLLRSFKVLTFSDECGIRKPDPEIFWLTLRQLAVDPKHAVHVGDDPLLDVHGAREAGLGGVIQVAGLGRAATSPLPDGVISRLEELPAALDQLTS